MFTVKRLSLGLLGFFLAVILSGCGAGRFTSTLKPSGEKDLSLGPARFSLIDFRVEKEDKAMDNICTELSKQNFAARSKALYPEIFSDDFTALPLIVKVKAEYDDSGMPLSAFLTAMTAGVVPFPFVVKQKYAVGVEVRDAVGDPLVTHREKFEFDQTAWVSLIGPLGLIPIPGESDLPRDGVFLFFPINDAYSLTKNIPYITDCIIEAIVQALRAADSARIKDAYQARRARLRELTVGGRRYWTFLVPSFSKGLKKQNKADLFLALFYQDIPQRHTKPLESVIVARRGKDDRWHPETGYLHSASRLIAVKTLLENGNPARIILETPETPPLEDFIDLPTVVSAQTLRWSNGMLLEAKNRTLPKLLREKNADELLTLVTRTEKVVLILNEASERAKDRAQQIVERGNGDPGSERELAVLFRQRIEILKPILQALKMRLAVTNH